MVLRLIGIISIGLSVFIGNIALSEVMFEGYYIIRLGGESVGYTVQRYEFDAKAKQFTSTYFLKTNATGGNITESLKARCNDKFHPIDYQYTNQTGDQIKTIDAKVEKEVLHATIFDGKTKNRVNKKLTKGTFFSTFLGYLMLQNGYSSGKKFTYSAVAEEDAEAYNGESFIKSEQTYVGQPSFRILNTFKGAEFVSFVSPKGEILGTTSPVQNISTELVPTAEMATKGHLVPNKSLISIFGAMPMGKVNVLAQGGAPAGKIAPPPTATAPAPSTATALPPPATTTPGSNAEPGQSGAPGKVDLGTPPPVVIKKPKGGK